MCWAMSWHIGQSATTGVEISESGVMSMRAWGRSPAMSRVQCPMSSIHGEVGEKRT